MRLVAVGEMLETETAQAATVGEADGVPRKRVSLISTLLGAAGPRSNLARHRTRQPRVQRTGIGHGCHRYNAATSSAAACACEEATTPSSVDVAATGSGPQTPQVLAGRGKDYATRTFERDEALLECSNAVSLDVLLKLRAHSTGGLQWTPTRWLLPYLVSHSTSISFST